MECKRPIPGTRTIVDSVWEVRLCTEEWERVKLAAVGYGTTYSWVVRWCVFSALRAENIEAFAAAVAKFRNSGKVGASSPGSHHRMQLCLYGADEMMLKCAAIRLNTTITAIIRVALRMFLHIFLETTVSSASFRENGLCITAKCIRTLRYSFSFIGGLTLDFAYERLINYYHIMKTFAVKKGDTDLIENSEF